MAIKNLSEIMDTIKEKFGEDTSDETIGFLEDISDTFNDYESRMGEDWKSKYEQNDREWREKYTSRFYKSSEETDDDFDDGFDKKPEKKILNFEDLFEIVKE